MDLKRLTKEQDKESLIILLAVPIILTLWVYFGKQSGFEQLYSNLRGLEFGDSYSTIYEYLAAFLLMFLLPLLIVRVILKGSPREYGLQWGDTKFGFRFVAIALPLILLAAYVGASDPAVRTEYPLAKSAMQALPLFLIVEMFYLLYYLGWEFFFRGFMLFGLEKSYGTVTAILIQTIPSALVHIGKPASESFAAILAGLAFGYLAIRSRSILYPLILHAAVGIGTDIFVTLQLV